MTTPPPRAVPIPQVADAEAKQLQLDRMKRRATGLLVVMSVVFVVTLALEPRYPWLGYVRATAEAASTSANWTLTTASRHLDVFMPPPAMTRVLDPDPNASWTHDPRSGRRPRRGPGATIDTHFV